MVFQCYLSRLFMDSFSKLKKQSLYMNIKLQGLIHVKNLSMTPNFQDALYMLTLVKDA
jgi:hypothetical protein